MEHGMDVALDWAYICAVTVIVIFSVAGIVVALVDINKGGQ